MSFRTISLFGLILSSAVTHAADITLDEALRQAKASREVITAALHRVKGAEAEASALSSLPPLILGVGLSTPTGFGPTDQDLSLQQGLDLFGRRDDLRQLGRAKVQAARSELKAAMLQVQDEAAKAFIQACAAKDAVKTAAEIRQISEELFKAAQRKVQEGRAPEVQAMRAKLEVERARQNEAAKESASILARKQLSAAIGSKELEDVIPEFSLGAEGEVEGRPDLLLIKSLAGAARAEESASRKAAHPEASLSVHRSPWGEDSRFGLRLQFTWSLLDQGKAKAEARAAEQERLALERAWQDKKKQAEAEIFLLEEEIRAARESLEMLRTLAQDHRLLSEKTRRGFEEGVGGMVEVLEAVRALREVELELQEADKKAKLLQIDLLSAKGALLEGMK